MWHGKPIVAMIACHSGDPDAAEQDLAPIKGFGRPIADLIMPKTYVEQQSMLNATQPKGANYYWKTEFIPELSEGYLESVRANAAEIESPMSQVITFHIAGGVNDHAEDDGAVGNRDAAFVVGAAAAWPSTDPNGDTHQQWARSSWDRIRPFSTGGNYINFQTTDDDVDPHRERVSRQLRAIAQDQGGVRPRQPVPGQPQSGARVDRSQLPISEAGAR